MDDVDAMRVPVPWLSIKTRRYTITSHSPAYPTVGGTNPPPEM